MHAYQIKPYWILQYARRIESSRETLAAYKCMHASENTARENELTIDEFGRGNCMDATCLKRRLLAETA